MVLVRHSELLGDHQGRHRERERGEEVGRVGAGQHGVDQVVDDLLDGGPHGLDPLDEERTVDRSAQPGVLGGVLVMSRGVRWAISARWALT